MYCCDPRGPDGIGWDVRAGIEQEPGRPGREKNMVTRLGMTIGFAPQFVWDVNWVVPMIATM